MRTPRGFLQERENTPAGTTVAETEEDTDDGRRGRRRLCCDACGAVITTDGARAEIGGAHEHHFVNPHGYDFHVGCFARAPGALPIGRATAHFSWFPGAPWRIAHCGACGRHVGWAYGVPTEFFGLILTRLREETRDE